MEEEQFFEEMKPLLKDYVEFTKEDMSKKWENMEKEALAKVEESQARRDEAKNKEKEARKKGETLRQAKRNLKGMVAIIGDEEYKSIEGKINQNVKKIEELSREYNHRYKELEQAKQEQQQTKATIEKEKQERLEQQKEKQGSIYEKAKGYIDSKKEEMNRNIEEKSSKLEEMRAKRKELASEAKAASELRLTLSKSTDEIKKSATYKALSQKANKELQKRKAMYKEYNQEMSRAKEELEGAKATLASFEEKYGAIDFSSEAGIQSLMEITGWKDEKEASAIEEDKDTLEADDAQKLGEEGHKQTEQSNEEVSKLGDNEVEVIEPSTRKASEEKKSQPEGKKQPKTEQEKWDEILEIYHKREEGYEDTLPRQYFREKYKVLGMKDVDEAMKIALPTKDMSLLEVIQGMKLLEESPANIEIWDRTIEAVEIRIKELGNRELGWSEKKMFKTLGMDIEAAAVFDNMINGFEDLLDKENYKKIDRIMLQNAMKWGMEKNLIRICKLNFSDFLKEQIKEAKDKGELETSSSFEKLLKEVMEREKKLQQDKERAKKSRKIDRDLNQAGQPRRGAQPRQNGQAAPTQGAQPRQNGQAGPTQGAQPRQAGTSQIIQSEQGVQEELPITRIEVNTNKGKVIVVYADSKKENKEYLIRDMLYDRRNYRGAIKDKIGEDILKRYDTKRDERNIKVC